MDDSTTDNTTNGAGLPIFECDQCGEIYYDRSIFVNHLRTHHGEKPTESPSPSTSKEQEDRVRSSFNCITCQKEFSVKEDLDVHISQTHTDAENEFTCDVCPKTFSSESCLEIHNERFHNFAMPFMCEKCGQRFLLASTLKLHCKCYCPEGEAEEESEGELLTCKICAAEFITEAYRLTHMEEIHGTKLHWCEYCRQGFSRSDYLRGHTESIHSGEGPFRCEFCGKIFSQIVDMKQHQRLFCTKEKPFTCTICKKMFVKAANLKRHTIQVHAGRSSYKCAAPQCGITFLLHSDLEKHYKWIHSKERPSTSAGCSSEFTIQSISNSSTMQSYAGETPQICELCGDSFPDEESLTDHILMHTARLFD